MTRNPEHFNPMRSSFSQKNRECSCSFSFSVEKVFFADFRDGLLLRDNEGTSDNDLSKSSQGDDEESHLQKKKGRYNDSSVVSQLRAIINEHFFAQSMHIKLASPQAARLSIFFVGKSVVLHLHEGPELRMHY